MNAVKDQIQRGSTWGLLQSISYPYTNRVETNRQRSGNAFEYELLDTGIFDNNRYFDVANSV